MPNRSRHHQHFIPNSAARLLDRGTGRESWKPLTDKKNYEIDRFAVYTFISSPEGVGTKEYTYALISAAPNGRWYLTPHIYTVS